MSFLILFAKHSFSRWTRKLMIITGKRIFYHFIGSVGQKYSNAAHTSTVNSPLRGPAKINTSNDLVSRYGYSGKLIYIRSADTFFALFHLTRVNNTEFTSPTTVVKTGPVTVRSFQIIQRCLWFWQRIMTL